MYRGLFTALFLGILLLVGSIILAGCPDDNGDDGDVIKIGVVLPTSGDAATYGKEAKNGIELALKQYDTDSLPKKVEFIYLDNKGDAKETENSVVELIQVHKVSAIIGSVKSTNSLAGGKIAQENQVPMMSPASTMTEVTEIGEYISRVCFIDPFQGSGAATFAYQNLNCKTAYLVVDQAADYSVGLANEFEKKFKALGGRVLDRANYNTKQDDFSPVIDRVAAAKPDVVFIPGYYAEVGPMLKQATAKWKDLVKLGGDGWDSAKLFDHADALINCYITNHFSADDEAEDVKKFVEAYQEAYDARPGAMAALGYDAALAMLEAIKKAGSDDPEKIKDAINSTSGLKGITGMITLNDKRDATKDLVILEVTPAGYKFKARISP